MEERGAVTRRAYPGIVVYVDADWNGWRILGEVRRALREVAGSPDWEVRRFTSEATSAEDFDGLLEVCNLWVALEARK